MRAARLWMVYASSSIASAVAAQQAPVDISFEPAFCVQACQDDIVGPVGFSSYTAVSLTAPDGSGPVTQLPGSCPDQSGLCESSSQLLAPLCTVRASALPCARPWLVYCTARRTAAGGRDASCALHPELTRRSPGDAKTWDMGAECAQAADVAPLTGLCSMTCEGPTNTSAGLVQQTGHIHLSFDSLPGQFADEACAASCQFISENVCAPNAGVLTCLGIGFPVIPAPAPEPATSFE